jgi:hypothetical protein
VNNALNSIVGLNWPWLLPIPYQGKRDHATFMANLQVFGRAYAQLAKLIGDLELQERALLVDDDTHARVGYVREQERFFEMIRSRDPVLLGWF